MLIVSFFARQVTLKSSPGPDGTGMEIVNDVDIRQVYGLITKFYFVCFLEENLFFYLPVGQINDLGAGCSLSFLPATPSPSLTLEGLFELTRHSSRVLNLASHVASKTAEIKTSSGLLHLAQKPL